MPRSSINPGVVHRLLRGGLVEVVSLPSPYRTHKGALIDHLRAVTAHPSSPTGQPSAMNDKLGAPLQIHVAVAEEIAEVHGYDQVVILARTVGDGGVEWVTTYGTTPEHKQAAAHIGKALREGVTPVLTRLRTLLGEAEALLPSTSLVPGVSTKRRALLTRIRAELADIKLIKDANRG